MHLISSMSPMPSLVSSYGLLVVSFFPFFPCFLLSFSFLFFSFPSSISFLSFLFFRCFSSVFFSKWLKSDVHMRSDRYYVI